MEGDRLKKALLTGVGAAAPTRILTNYDFEKMVDTSDEWIVTRTGIRERHVVEDGMVGTDLALEASRQALREAELSADELDLILLGTVTPDFIVPSSACILQKKIGATKAAAMDVVAGCTGFIYGLATANAFIRSGMYENILVIGVEVLSKLTDYKDRNTCVLFGDAAGAVVVQAAPPDEKRGILSAFLAADGNLANLLHVPMGGTVDPLTPANFERRGQYIKMAGNEVFKSAVREMGEAATLALEKAGCSPDELTLLIPHQANIRIIEATAKRLGLPMEKVYVNIDRYGNTSSASVPLALWEARREGKVKDGDLVLLVAFGAGFTWGSVLVRL
ncbi:MAG: ketoacyl-ACP synthase III [candidate division Zixibacteria bacterium]|nr:ketoacyl-ACP synthase III [candidate division Zixibacteria bacterium]